MEKPFFWILINRPFSQELLLELVTNLCNNIGIAIYDEIAEKTDPAIFDLCNTKYKIPLAIYFSKRDISCSNFPDIFSTTIHPFHKDALLKKSEFFRFKISTRANKKIEAEKILNQLSEYFLFKGSFPEKEAFIELGNLSSAVYDARFFNLMQKLGIRKFLIPFSGKNLQTIKNETNNFQMTTLSNGSENPASVNLWRIQIDELDYALIEILKKRIRIVREMGQLKKQQNLPFFEAERWKEILTSRKKIAKATNVDEELVEKIFEAIHLNNLKLMLREED